MMRRVKKEVIATKMIEVYERDHARIKKQAEQKGMTIRAYIHYLADKEDK